jgi:beta-barrel assembly-enhancing protease
MTSAKARLFGGDLPATGEPADIELDAGTLTVHCGGARLTTPLSALRVREIESVGATIELSWESSNGQMAAQVAGREAVRDVNAALATLPQLAALQRQRRRTRIRRSLGWAAIGFFLVVPVLAILLFGWQADHIAQSVARRISIEQEARLGKQMFEGIGAQMKLRVRGSDYDAVAAIGGRLTDRSRYSYQFHVAEDDSINAFAVPGGFIVVHTGLIAATRSAEELAGVLAHEIQHVEMRHSLTALIKDLGLTGLWLLVSGDTGGLTSAAFELTSLKFSRDAETQADETGFGALVAAGIDPRGMPQFLGVLSEREGAAPAPFLSTHPAGAERQARLRVRLNALGERDFEPLRFERWPPGGS